MSFSDIVPILEYFQEPEVQEKMEEVGRIIWSNNSISINLGAVAALGLLALALLGGLLFLLFAGDGGGETAGYGYGYEQTDYVYGGDFAQRSVSLSYPFNTEKHSTSTQYFSLLKNSKKLN